MKIIIFFSKEYQEKHLETTDEISQYCNRKCFSSKYKLWRRQQRISSYDLEYKNEHYKFILWSKVYIKYKF